MQVLTHKQAFQVLLLQAADEGRRDALFGESFERARAWALPFLVGKQFPDVYLEHPLSGNPFLDVTVLFGSLEPGIRIASPAAGEHGAMLDFFAEARSEHSDVSCGFEIDSSKQALSVAAIHFQPRQHSELVRPFCEVVGEPERAELYLSQDARMPDEWKLAFFGMFRGRPGFPLRVCGYLNFHEAAACAKNPERLAAIFDVAGFTAYNDAMLSQVSALMSAAPGGLDFQLDILPDGSLGPTFALDIQFGIERPEAVRKSFAEGPGAAVMKLLESWGAADGRWQDAVRSAFARALPVETEEGDARYALTLMPQWVKARWIEGVLQPAKLYHLAHAGTLE